MIIKNIINNINIISLLFLITFLYLINYFIITSNIREKFFSFIILFFLFSSIGLYYNLDGIVMLFMVCELSIILIFITMFSQLYLFDKKNKKFSYINLVIFIFFLNIEFYSTKILIYKNFYSYYSININDFYYIYNSYFEKHIIITIIISFLITIYSLFFILLYFNFKKIQNVEFKKKEKINLLRKQNLIHQANYKTKIRIFQNNK